MKTEPVRTAKPLIASAEEVLKQHFGFGEFLDGQGEVIDEILTGRDGLVVMPTGGGKSLCYQVPALCFPGVTLVISPLIALMKDQVDALQNRGIPATLINSSLAWQEQRERLDGVRQGRYKLLYIAPERFRAESFLNALEGVEVSLFAIDEAHCLSQWGHDFRPDYLRLGKALAALGGPQCIALTATATPTVREDIRRVLQLREPFERVSGFSRPNLSLNIRHVDKAAQKDERLRALIGAHRTGIVYCATRKKVEQVSETLHAWGISCTAYHGGMSDAERESAQEYFITKRVDVAVATNAFGMGIDRADVRFVIHYEIPGSVEAYYQEAGRAGRDGGKATCELLFNYADTRTQEFFIDGSNPGAATIRAIYQYLQNEADAEFEVKRTLEEIARGAEVKNTISVGSALGTLARAGMIARFDIPGKRMRGTRLLRPDILASALELDEKSIEAKDARDREKLKSMIELCYSRDCRQQWILGYFGEGGGVACGCCDRCRDDHESAREATVEELLVVRKVLAGVARMSEKSGDAWIGRYGRNRIVQMLCGSRAQEIVQGRLDQLSTYGILSACPPTYLNSLIRSLHDAGFLETATGDYPLVTLSASGETLMKAGGACRMKWPELVGGTNRATGDGGFDPDLYGKLRELRTSLATHLKVPHYSIFPNRTLEAMAREQPANRRSAMRLPGIGQAKAHQFLDPFLNVIRAHGNKRV